jgi:tRNA A37 threonylcarbamoyladenosine dehydratase
MDKVDPSNLNRQILFNKDDIGKSKALVAVSFARKIREDVVVIPEEYRVSEESLNEHDYSSCSFFIDAIDDIEAKVALISYAEKHNIKIVVSLGMGNRLDPSTIYLTVLSKTEGDPLAKKLRSCCRKKGIDLSNIVCVASKEEPLVRGAKPSSLMGVPSGAGLLMASYVISSLDKE